MHDFVTDLLACPVCRGTLRWDYRERDGARIESADAAYAGCGTAHPVQDGIGVFLPPHLARNDLREQSGSTLTRFLHAHPDLEHRLTEARS